MCGGGLQVSFFLALSLFLFPFLSSHQVVLFEVELQDGVFDSGKDEADILRVSGACEMGVDDLVTVWVQVHKHLQDELPTCLGVSLGTWEDNRPLFLASIEHLVSITEPLLIFFFYILAFLDHS